VKGYRVVIRLLFLTLISLFSISLAAGCSTTPEVSPRDAAQTTFDALRTEVRSGISNEEKQTQLLVMIDELEQIALEAADEKASVMERIAALNADYDATPEQFDAILASFREHQKVRHCRITEVYEEARAVTTDDEWSVVGKMKKEALERALDAGKAAEIVR
jgi:hypothetical protein